MGGVGSLALDDWGDRVGEQAVSFPVDSYGRDHVRCIDQAEHLARAFVVPVLEVPDTEPPLDFEIAAVCSGDRFCGQACHLFMHVHEQRYGEASFTSGCRDAIGVRTEVVVAGASADWVELWDRTEPPRAAVGGWVADYPDPDTFLRVCVELDLPDWKHDRYRALLDRAARGTDPAVRSAAYEEAERTLAEEAVVVPIAYEPEHLMLKPWVAHYPTIPVKYPGFWKDVMIGSR